MTFTREEAAAKAGVDPSHVDTLVELGVLAIDGSDSFSAGDVRRITMIKTLERAGVGLDDLGQALREGAISLDFLDAPAYERFSSLCDETFQQVSDRTGIPLDLLVVLREAVGLADPSPDDRLREDELRIVPFVELQVSSGFKPSSIERLLRVHGDCTRRMAESEGAWWNDEVIAPALASGNTEEIASTEFANALAPLAEQTMLAMYHLQQERAWTTNIIGDFEAMMENAGIHTRLERLPAICFLDITGYTRLTQERGDDAAADLAVTVSRLVQRSSVQRGGKPIKWLGDGVMFYFGDPGPGVRAALEMVDGLAQAGLPPAHVGLHAGPVLFQEGDYFGQTVNLTSRVADYARPGEVLVTQAVADVSSDQPISFADIGAVELKGVAGTVHLLRAQMA
jgi:adenylate cyclase